LYTLSGTLEFTARGFLSALDSSHHPALFSIGVTLVTGLTAGYVTALCAIPFLARFLLKKEMAE